ncbi:MAG: hypothetical protein RL139_97 [Gemmatimonadota bacterium]|jgi:hypothetical protein
MKPNLSFGVITELSWRGVGDIDECAPTSDLMCVHAVAGWETLYDIPHYRAAAGNPDDPTQGDGLTNAQSVKALRTLYPKLTALPGFAYTEYTTGGPTGSDFAGAILKRQSVASVSVIAGKLPVHGTFTGQHRIAVAANGTSFLYGDPLKAPYSEWRTISVAALAIAIEAYPKNVGGGVIFLPTVDEAFTTHPLYATAAPEARAKGIADAAAAAAAVK